MTALFKVKKVYNEGYNVYIIEGEIIEGKIVDNMQLLIPLNKSTNCTLDIDSFSIEKTIKLKCNYEDEFEYDLIVALNIINEVLILQSK